MTEGGACLLDSNILLRISKNDDTQQPIIANALRVLIGKGVRLCYTSQTLAEFWNASTRPRDKNGFGLTVAETDSLAQVIERDFELLPESRETHERWRALLVQHSIQGVQVHDARLAASMFRIIRLESRRHRLGRLVCHGNTVISKASPQYPLSTQGFIRFSEPAQVLPNYHPQPTIPTLAERS